MVTSMTEFLIYLAGNANALMAGFFLVGSCFFFGPVISGMMFDNPTMTNIGFIGLILSVFMACAIPNQQTVIAMLTIPGLSDENKERVLSEFSQEHLKRVTEVWINQAINKKEDSVK